jgi:hypothetical protein
MNYDLNLLNSSDLREKGPRLVRLLNFQSKEVMPGPACVPNAKAGDFVIPRLSGDDALVGGEKGFRAIPLGIEKWWIAWRAERGASSYPLGRFTAAPAGAFWIEGRDGKKALLNEERGVKYEETDYVHLLVGSEVAVLPCKSTALPGSQGFARAAESVTVTIDNATVKIIGAYWRIYSEMQRNDMGQWYLPRFKFLAKFGDQGGPTEAEVRQAIELRIKFKTDYLAALKTANEAERAQIQALPQQTLASPMQAAPPRTSGQAMPSQAFPTSPPQMQQRPAAPPPPPPSAASSKPPFNDDIPPWLAGN